MIGKKEAVIPLLLIGLMIMAGCTDSRNNESEDVSGGTSSVTSEIQTEDTSGVFETTADTLGASETKAETTSEEVLIPMPSPPPQTKLGEGEFMVLPREGAYYNVFDDQGKVVGSFFSSDEDRAYPIGVYDEATLAKIYNPYMDKLKAQIPKAPEGQPPEDTILLNTTANGFYQIDYKTNEVSLYDKDGRNVCEIKNPMPSEENVDIRVRVLHGETVVAYQKSAWSEEYANIETYMYFVAPNGTINDLCKAINLPGKLVGLIGRKYFMVSVTNASGDESINLYDFSGNLADQGIEGSNPYSDSISFSEVSSIDISDYYIKGQEVYGPDLKPVEADSLDKDGNLIFGMVYHINGIECTVEHVYYNDSAIAVGYKGDTVVLKTADFEFEEDLPGYTFKDMNGNTIVFKEGDNLHLFSKTTGKETAILEDNFDISVANEYITVYEDSNSFYIIDKEGNRRYSSSQSTVRRCTGEYIILERGPYIGIADLDGNWIQKTLTWELTRDRQYNYE